MKHLDYAKREQDIARMVAEYTRQDLCRSLRVKVTGEHGKASKYELAARLWNVKHTGLYRMTRPRCWSVIN